MSSSVICHLGMMPLILVPSIKCCPIQTGFCAGKLYNPSIQDVYSILPQCRGGNKRGLDTLSFSTLSAAAMSHRQRCILTFHCTACTTLSHANEIMIKQLFYWFLHRRRNSMSKLRQFRTTWDDSGQFGTKCCAIIVGSKMMVLVYPLSMSFFAAQRIFAGCRTVRLVTECSSRPAERP